MSHNIADPRLCKIQSDFCSVMGNQKRVQIMWRLQHGECTVSELAEELETSIANISQHLRVMRDKGAVLARKEGQQVHYRIANPKFLEACRLIREGLAELHTRRGEALGLDNTLPPSIQE